MRKGDTVPFLARYRKEQTGGMSEITLRALESAIERASLLESRREAIRGLLEKANVTDPALFTALATCSTMDALEDIYLPYKVSKATLAQRARDAGFEPIANNVLHDAGFNTSRVDPQVAHIVTEVISHIREVREAFRNGLWERGWVTSTAVTTARKRVAKEMSEEEHSRRLSVYRTYEKFSKKPSQLLAHQAMAVLRGEEEGMLAVKFNFLDEDSEYRRILPTVQALCPGFRNTRCKFRQNALDTAWKKYLFPQAETFVRALIYSKASEGCLEVFRKNLRSLLLTRPLQAARIFAMDPGYKTIKCVALDEYGNVIPKSTTMITNLHESATAVKAIRDALVAFQSNKVVIGNGSGSRMCELLVAEALKVCAELKDVEFSIVSEVGASVYSASEAAVAELPDMDVLYRGAVSIGRRLQDPLSELVKIAPRSLGVGMYQHDLKEKELEKCLRAEIESCVNAVGVNLNTATAFILPYVAGLRPKVAEAILVHRQTKGPFASREELRQIRGITPQIFEQCAGFLRIRGGSEPLDNTGVHPESYHIARVLSAASSVEHDMIVRLAAKHSVSLETIRDVAEELRKGCMDPRETLPFTNVFRHDVLDVSQLAPGMVLQGVVSNLTSFGAFVNVGVGRDALLGIKFCSNDVSIGTVVKVVVESVTFGDTKKSLEACRINLRMG